MFQLARTSCARCAYGLRDAKISGLRNARYSRTLSTGSPFLRVSEEVQQAVIERKPVVALESTIYTHGFPHPANLSLASHLEAMIRANGGVPATIGILDGIARVGLSPAELARLVTPSSKSGLQTLKVSRRDLGFVCGLRDPQGNALNGGTTIAGTMILAHLAGIKVFATGGLGGVHRGAEQTMDISADLTELGRTPVAVISSGCKSFLDLPRTLEYLETQGVSVATFADGRQGNVDMPGFWTRESGVPSPKTLKESVDAARVIHAHHSLGLQSGLAFSNPIPEAHSISLEVMEKAIGEALEQAQRAGITGAPATPYILDKIKELTGEKSLEANWALIESNIIRGTEVACELAKLENGEPVQKYNQRKEPSSHIFHPTTRTSARSKPPSVATSAVEKPSGPATKPTVFVAGTLALDLACDYAPPATTNLAIDPSSSLKPANHTSNPAHISQSLGGVGSNVARASHLMGADVRLCSAVGDDLSGQAALKALAAMDMSTEGVKVVGDGARTAQYIAVNDSHKNLVFAVADMDILNASTSGSQDALNDFWLPQLRAAKPSHLVLDANWSPAHLAHWLATAKEIGAHVTFEPVSNVKGAGIFKTPEQSLPVYPHSSVHLATPNSHELAEMHSTAREKGYLEQNDWWSVIDALGIPSTGARTQMALATSSDLVDQGIPQQSIQLLPFMPRICTKLGEQGVLVTQLLPAGDERLTSGEYAPYILSRCTNGTEESLGVGGVYMRLFAPPEQIKQEDVVSVNGVGDTFVGTVVAGMAKSAGGSGRVEDFVDLGQRAAGLSLRSRESVSPGLGALKMLL